MEKKPEPLAETPTRKPKFRRRADARPDEVLDAALELFLQNGYAATTVQMIARRAGLSKGAVYVYFPSKQALLEGLVQRAVVPIADQALAGVAGYRGDPRPVLRHMLETVADKIRDARTLAVPSLVIREAATAPEIAQMYREQVLDKVLPTLTALLAQGVEAGFIRPVDPELTIRTIIGPLLMHLMLNDVFSVHPKDGLAVDRLIQNHLLILFAGLEPERETQHEHSLADPEHPDRRDLSRLRGAASAGL
jgi:AcrR family transcriptional regulator